MEKYYNRIIDILYNMVNNRPVTFKHIPIPYHTDNTGTHDISCKKSLYTDLQQPKNITRQRSHYHRRRYRLP